MHSKWPTPEQVSSAAKRAKLTVPLANAYSDMAVARFESATGWSPYLRSSAKVLRIDPPFYWRKDTLILPAPMVEITSVHSYWRQADEDGTILTEGEDYELDLVRLPGGVEAIHGLKFLTSPGSARRSIRIAGTSGAVSGIDNALWQAVLNAAVALATGEGRGGMEGPVTEIKQGMVSMKAGTEAGRSRTDTWLRELDSIARSYRRPLA